MTKPPTMINVLHLLNAGDKAIICRALREHSVRYGGSNIHQGLLPFVDVCECYTCLRALKWQGTGERRITKIQFVLREWLIQGTVKPKPMYLNDAKVAKWFGSHPERGKPVDFLGKVRVTAGVKWSLPKQDYVPDDDVLVRPVVALRPVKKGLWEIICDEKYRPKVEQWLCDNLR